MREGQRRLAVIVHSLDQALAAASVAAECQVGLTLESAAGAAGNAGIGWFVALVARIRELHPTLDVGCLLDCGSEPGVALAALRRGMLQVRLSANAETLMKVSQIAAHYGASIETSPTTASDLLTVADPAAFCREMLLDRDAN